MKVLQKDENRESEKEAQGESCYLGRRLSERMERESEGSKWRRRGKTEVDMKILQE